VRSVPSAAYVLAGLLLLGLPAAGQAAWSSDPAMTVSLCADFADQWEPRGTTDGSGGAIFAWRDERPGQSFADIYAQRVDANGIVLWTANGVVVDSAANLQHTPHVTSDGHGGAYVMWVDLQPGSEQMKIMRIDAAGALAWPAPKQLSNSIYEARVARYVHPLVPDGSGGAIAAWNDTYGHVYAQRVDLAGNFLWGSGPVELASSFNSAATPTVDPDGTGGAVIAWSDFRSFSSTDVYAQKLDAAGTPQWAVNGAPVAVLAANQFGAVVTYDGAGGAIVAWKDARSMCEVYVQRIDASGMPAWTPNGISLGLVQFSCGNEYTPIVSDGAGGAIVAWDGSGNIRAQRVDASGNKLWGSGPITVCGAAGYQGASNMVPDNGGAIIVWTDNRNFSFTPVYGQRLDATGAALWQADGDTIAFRSTSNPDVVSVGTGEVIVAFQSLVTGQDIEAQKYPVPGTVDVPAPESPGFALGVSPRPAAGSVLLQWTLPRAAHVTLTLYDAAGRGVRVLHDGPMNAGASSIRWDGTNDRGSRAPAGIYFARLSADGRERMTRVVMLGR